MVTAKEVASFGILEKLLEIQHVREDEGETVPLTIVDVIKLAF